MLSTTDDFRDCLFLTGPTASGKTGLGILVAEQMGAEIVSLDSMALYREMDIGTAKPTAAERQRVPHHLVDILSPDQEFSVAAYLQAAADAVGQIRARGVRPLFVGGTPLYLKALLRGFSSGPAANWEIRKRLLDQAQAAGAESLHQALSAVDPRTAARLHPNDVRRIVRALEVHELTGQPISEQQTQFDAQSQHPHVVVLDWPRAVLQERINARVDGMFAAGMVEEARRLRASWVLSRTARQAVGYCEVFDYLEGKQGLAETVSLVQLRTRQFAKRQMTWFRSLAECQFLPLAEPLDPQAMAMRIGEQFRSAR